MAAVTCSNVALALVGEGFVAETLEERVLRCACEFYDSLNGAEIDVAEPAGSALRALLHSTRMLKSAQTSEAC